MNARIPATRALVRGILVVRSRRVILGRLPGQRPIQETIQVASLTRESEKSSQHIRGMMELDVDIRGT